MIVDQITRIINLKSVVAGILLSTCLTIPVAYGQTSSDVQSWNTFLLDWNFQNRWLFELELDYNRLLSSGPVWRELATQPSIEFYPNNSFDLFAGMYITSTKQNEQEDTEELRPLIGFRWNIIKPERRVFLRTQVKFEYRIFTTVSTQDQVNNGRLRTRLDLFVPITKTSYSADDDLYAIAWTEAFLNFDNEIRERYQSTFRQYLGLGYRFSYSWRFETYYVFQSARDSITDEVPDTINHVIFLMLKYYIKRK